MATLSRWFGVLAAALLAACSSGPDLQIPDGLTRFELLEIVTETNPLWDPVERSVTDIQLLQGRRVSDDRYELDAEYEVVCLNKREPINAAELQRFADSMRRQGREQEWQRIEAQRLAAAKLLAERVDDMQPGEKRRFRDTFVLVRIGQSWLPEATAERMRADGAAATR